MKASHRYRNIALYASLLTAIYLLLRLSVPSPLFDRPTSTVVLSADGSLLSARIADDGQWRFAPSDSIPDKFSKCLIAFEDKRFYHHLGVDFIAICRALSHNIKSHCVVEGGSTITMQIARMSRGNQSRTIWQKIIEAFTAVGIELKYSKDEILAIYTSNAPFGGNVVGLEAAAWRYFGRPSSLLSWAECATLAVLPNAPSLINVGRNRSELQRKRDRLLKSLCDNGIISHEEYSLSLLEALPEKPYPLEDIAPHLLDRITKENKGKTVISTIDISLQKRLQNLADIYSDRYRSNHIENIAILVAEVNSGNVLAYIGNSTLPSNARNVDMVSAERSTGSLLKPFLYAAMLTDGEISPNMLIQDTPLNINGFAPRNYSHTFYGAVNADEAIRRSLNVPLVRMLSTHGIGRFMDNLKDMGMNTLHFSGDHYGASLILGGAEGSLYNMLGMYASMARLLIGYSANNYRVNPNDVHPLVYSSSLPFDEPYNHSSLSISPSAIWYTLEAMSGLDRPEEESEWWHFSSMKRVAWKTGTSYGGRDAWAMGVTPDYAVGVWVGNANGEGRAGMTGVGFAAPVMFDTFSALSSSDWFVEPLEDTDPLVVCRKSGCRASQCCEFRDTLNAPRSTISSPLCGYCRLVHLSADEKWQVNSNCESVANMVTRPWFVLPPSMEYYFKKYHASYRGLPPMRADCDGAHHNTIDIIYPENNQVLVIPKGFSGEYEQVICHAATSKQNDILYWHLDDTYIGQTDIEHKVAILPTEGQHILTIVSQSGNEKSISFEVK
ncbi:MAG: penicillin-binding protein 1C [Bacteroidia bacterium]|nr:penicillin-binding protein 1C [Bacteroidia bacterium]